MYGVRHHLSNDFPEFETMIEYLKNSDAEFTRLLDQYHEADNQICGYEKTIISQERIDQLKKWRVQLKDRLYEMLKSYEVSREYEGVPA